MVTAKPRVHDRLPGFTNRRVGTFQGHGQMPHELALGVTATQELIRPCS